MLGWKCCKSWLLLFKTKLLNEKVKHPILWTRRLTLSLRVFTLPTLPAGAAGRSRVGLSQWPRSERYCHR